MRVLLVEGRTEEIALLRNALGNAHKPGGPMFEVVAVGCLDEALKHLADAPFDAALLSVSPSCDSALDSLSRVYSAYPHLPIIVLGEREDEELALQAAHRGAQDYLARDTRSWDSLAERIHCAIKRKRLEVERRSLIEGALRESRQRLEGLPHRRRSGAI